ncbi:ribosome maturation factor RimM [Bacteroidia bacterium]|nr:ribosome maturation factor RimM [Bacteroidia bacterium]
MIKREDLVKIGRFNKPHGIKGEISFGFTNDSFEDSENPFFICELDGILVPFRLEDYRFTSDSAALVRLKNIDSDKKVRLLAHKEVYFLKTNLRKDPDEETYTWDYFIGFTLVDEKSGEIGRISAVDDSTLNTLFIIEQNNVVKARHALPLLIPAADEMITHIDEEQRKIYVELPEGLLTL